MTLPLYPVYEFPEGRFIKLEDHLELVDKYMALRVEHSRCHYLSQLPHAVSPREHEVICNHETKIPH